MNPTANPAAAKIAARKLRCGISRAFKVSNTEHPKPASTATLKVATRINRSFFKAFRMGNCCTTQKAGPIPYTADSAAAVESAKKSTYRREECSRATGAATKLNIPIYAACSGMSSPIEFDDRTTSRETRPSMLHIGSGGQLANT